MRHGVRKLPDFDSSHKNDTISERKQSNGKLMINRLPSEVLSRIMFIGVHSDQRVWRWGPRKMGSQQIASHVCSRWRDVAIHTPELWTFIHIGSTIPSDHSAIYLSRAGSIDLLDVAIDLSSPFGIYDPADPEQHDQVLFFKQGDSRELFQELSGILNLLTAHGAETSRWRSLLIRTEELGGQELSSLIECFGQCSVPNLQRLYLGHYRTTFGRMLLDDDIDHSTGQISEGARTFFESLSSNLLCLELELSFPYIFESTWTFTKLKTLTIVSYKLGYFQLATLLLNNPQLEHLCLSDDDEPRSIVRSQTGSDRFPLADQRIFAPSLRSLSIHTKNRAIRARQILAAIEAAGLHSFALKCIPKDPKHIQSLVTYITLGPDDHTESPGLGGSSIFPSLQCLDISHFACTRNQTSDLVSAFPELTHLVVGEQQLLWLGETPSKIPEDQTLGVLGLTGRAKAAMDFLSRRAPASNPIKEVKAKGGRLKLSVTRHKKLGLALSCLFDSPAYEHYQCDEDVTIGDLQSLERRSASSHTLFPPRCSSIDDLDQFKH
ncbi:unnamed protein product [Rhizoctonia solani]|uniref:F-box domain-containing protein n=1 Tax=Rhizoctonia solani TaxID=456999 RepID=A0A8H3HE06_9AGAM|nr:unnamed protein product [Rhizoctonia solani]CAE6501206.1 unnamed protein product [Rhizoctonia solani]